MVLNDIIDQVSERPMSKATHLSSAFQAFSSSPNHHHFHHSHRQSNHGPHYHCCCLSHSHNHRHICNSPKICVYSKYILNMHIFQGWWRWGSKNEGHHLWLYKEDFRCDVSSCSCSIMYTLFQKNRTHKKNKEKKIRQEKVIRKLVAGVFGIVVGCGSALQRWITSMLAIFSR